MYRQVLVPTAVPVLVYLAFTALDRRDFRPGYRAVCINHGEVVVVASPR